MAFDVKWIFHLSLRLMLGLDPVRNTLEIESAAGIGKEKEGEEEGE
jgi:hypothetical protein